jgi:hypothetical protein
LTGLDPAGVIYKWEMAEPLDEDKAIYMGTLNASSGVVKNEVRYFSDKMATYSTACAKAPREA